ncbi:MAG: hypothetical protein WCJ14_00070 [Verrucomicrobiota bacterium]
MIHDRQTIISAALGAAVFFPSCLLLAGEGRPVEGPGFRATMSDARGAGRSYELSSTANLRDNHPADKRVVVTELPDHARIRTGNVLFDGLYALAVGEAVENSVAEISDNAYSGGAPIRVNAYQTGAKWKYVWTRDLAYSLHLSLAGFDPTRAADSLLFKASGLKPAVHGGFARQMVQDTGSGGSYPVSSDRVVWALGAYETSKYLAGAARERFIQTIYPIFRDTIEQDRQLVFDVSDGLYRGEQSFLDWREQTYPGWTANNVLAVGMSKAVSVNAANYFLLEKAGEFAGVLGDAPARAKYQQWAAELKAAINRRFWDGPAGLYRTYLLSDDGTSAVAVNRYDLLGQSLAILLGVADRQQAERMVASYPTGPIGPPVVWPQERGAPIYHNQAIWPFVTAYWTKAAKAAGNAAAVDAGIESLSRLAAANLSNMENYDFITGQAEVAQGPRQGPVINSQRQLWSVGGYLAMVQDVVFGLETSVEGIRFAPFITAKLRNGSFAAADAIELQNFDFQGTRNRVRVSLPGAGTFSSGVCTVAQVTLNGATFTGGFANAEKLRAENIWEIALKAPVAGGRADSIKRVDVSDEAALFSPLQPEWDDAMGGITLGHGQLTLHYKHPDARKVLFTIYRDGKLCAENLRETQWNDPQSADFEDHVRAYTITATCPKSGNVSHPAPARCYRTPDQQQVIPAQAMANRGGNLVGGHHFENWGKPGDTLATRSFQVPRSGRHSVRMEFSNGSGPVNTGITCAVKRLVVCKVPSGEAVGSGYLVMPHSGDWRRWDLSNAIAADLVQGESYSIRLSEDDCSRNMSYLKSNERYTALPGGGDDSYNYVNISAAHVLYLKPPVLLSRKEIPSQ